MPAADDVTTGELARAIGRLEKAIAELRSDSKDEAEALRRQVATLNFVRADVWTEAREALHERIDTVRAVAEADVAELRRDLTGTQENLRWLARAFVGALVTAIVTALVVGAIR